MSKEEAGTKTMSNECLQKENSVGEAVNENVLF